MTRSAMNGGHSTVLLAIVSIALACGGSSGLEEGTSESTSNLIHRQTYRVGGTISGLSGTVVLQDNGADDLSRSVDGSFTFATALRSGSTYSVTVVLEPAGQTCTVANGSGTIARANVTSVLVSCTTNPLYTVGGAISGLSGTVVLQDIGKDDLAVSANGPFTFATALADGSTYSVTVLSQPAGQTCTVANESGMVAGANVTNAAVSCTTSGLYTVGGSVSGPSGTVVLQNTGKDDLTLSADGPFTFATALANGSTYAVTVFAQPFFQSCTVSNGSGTITGINVTDVWVSCATTGGFFTGFCVVDETNGQLTGDCWDPGNCFSGRSPYCSADPLPPLVASFCGPLLDNTFCIF